MIRENGPTQGIASCERNRQTSSGSTRQYALGELQRTNDRREPRYVGCDAADGIRHDESIGIDRIEAHLACPLKCHHVLTRHAPRARCLPNSGPHHQHGHLQHITLHHLKNKSHQARKVLHSHQATCPHLGLSQANLTTYAKHNGPPPNPTHPRAPPLPIPTPHRPHARQSRAAARRDCDYRCRRPGRCYSYAGKS